MRHNAICKLSAVAAFLALVGSVGAISCTSGEEAVESASQPGSASSICTAAQPSQSTAESRPKGSNKTLGSGGVPPEAQVPDTMCGERECGSILPPADTCAWAAQADAVVVARVTSLHLLDRPAFGLPLVDGQLQEVRDCKNVNPALAIGLEVEQVLSGVVEGSVVLLVGASQLQHFQPLPYRDSSGLVQWLPTLRPNRGPLRIDQRIVAGMHKISVGWSLMGDTILGVDASGRVRVVERAADCLDTDPVDLDGFGVETMAAEMCCNADPSDTEARRSARSMRWGEDKSALFTHAAICLDPDPEATVEPENDDIVAVEATIPGAPIPPERPKP